MSSRRDFLKTTGFGLLLQVLPEALHAQSRAGTEFDRLLQSTIENEALISMGRDLRERQIDEFEFYAARGVAPRKGRSGRPISERAAKLIVSFEVTDQKAYQQKYQGAIWPQGQSGITIGIGYDVGYVTKVWLHEDWDGLVEPTQLSLLEIACEVPGPRAQGMLPRLSSIKIPWSTAYQEFRERVLPLYISETLSALPNSDKLSDDCLGALVSLVYNRGATFKGTTDRYAEMRDIHLHMVQERFDLIPGDLRAMKHIWADLPSMKGLVIRRELEAKLFEAGLS